MAIGYYNSSMATELAPAQSYESRPIPGGPPGHDYHENNFVEFGVRCGACGLRICRVVAEVFPDALHNAWFVDPNLGKQKPAADERHDLGYGRSLECVGGEGGLWNESFMFVCRGKRCRFRRLVRRTNVSKGMTKAWNRGSYEIVAGVDF